MQFVDTGLATVLKVKKYQEKKAHEELVHLLRSKDVEQAALSDLNDRRENAMSEAVRVSRSRALELQTSRAFLKTLSTEIRQKEKKVNEIQLQENDKRSELVERTQSKQMVENLDQRRQAEFIREADRKEQRLIDVLAQRVTREI
ncbi:MAG TPA: flagellar export protein FliJ [Bacteroidota bacterium]|nr:flagellar export protein FliJ [Bacteroidota bacterium]